MSELLSDFLNPFQELQYECRSAFERNVLHWCIENYVPLKQFSSGELLVLFYEEVLRNPESEIRKLFTYLGKPYDPEVLDRLGRPAAMSYPFDAPLTADDGIHTWHGRVPYEHTRRAVELISAFGLHKIYGEDPMPDSTQVEPLFVQNGHLDARA